MTDVLDQHFSTAATQKVLLVWIELERVDRDALVDLCGRYAPFAHQLLRVVLSKNLLDVPKSDGTVLHAAGDDAQLVDLVDPIEG